jgi:hypothetical protein
MTLSNAPDERYLTALELAWSKLTDSNIQALSADAGAFFHNSEISLPTFNQRITIDITTRRMRIGSEELAIFDKILALHYLLGCDRSKPTGNLISFAQAPGGEVYYSAFKKRSIDRLAEMFGDDPESLLKAGSLLGGESLEMATAAVQLFVYPMLPVVVLIWQGDDEVATAANLLFDESAARILATEDLAVVGSSVVTRLGKANQGAQ